MIGHQARRARQEQRTASLLAFDAFLFEQTERVRTTAAGLKEARLLREQEVAPYFRSELDSLEVRK